MPERCLRDTPPDIVSKTSSPRYLDKFICSLLAGFSAVPCLTFLRALFCVVCVALQLQPDG